MFLHNNLIQKQNVALFYYTWSISKICKHVSIRNSSIEDKYHIIIIILFAIININEFHYRYDILIIII